MSDGIILEIVEIDSVVNVTQHQTLILPRARGRMLLLTSRCSSRALEGLIVWTNTVQYCARGNMIKEIKVKRHFFPLCVLLDLYLYTIDFNQCHAVGSYENWGWPTLVRAVPSRD